jgi:hypothetical protein
MHKETPRNYCHGPDHTPAVTMGASLSGSTSRVYGRTIKQCNTTTTTFGVWHDPQQQLRVGVWRDPQKQPRHQQKHPIAKPIVMLTLTTLSSPQTPTLPAASPMP